MKNLFYYFIFLLIPSLCFAEEIKKIEVTAASPKAIELLAASDRARGAAASTDGVSWVAQVKTNEGGEEAEATYRIRVRENNALAEAVAPARLKGDTILFNDRTLWFNKPGLKKPVSISPRQKLMGQAANGDIASTHYARDYDGEISGEEKVNGILTWKLDLKAKAKNVTYDRITYWISKNEKLGVKAEFITVSGEIYKRAEFKYENSISIKGQKFPFVSEMKIIDAINPKNMTTLRYESPKEENHPKSIFNVNNLMR